MRGVTPLYVEALHLLVKEEFADSVAQGLDALHGRTVDLGPSGSSTPVSRPPSWTSPVSSPAVPRPPTDTCALVVDPPRAPGAGCARRSLGLPDAVLHLATVPSIIALQLIRSAGYRLVPLPFAEAFRLGTLIADEPTQGAASTIERRHVSDTVIPAFTYEIDPPSPTRPYTRSEPG